MTADGFDTRDEAEPVRPVLDSVSPDAGAGGTAVTLRGRFFGASGPASTIYFRLPGGTTDVAAAVTTWSDTSIAATVPPLTSFGTGGPLEVLVATAGGRSSPLIFSLHEGAAPTISSIAPAAELEGKPVTISGQGFGRGPLAGSAVVFATPGSTGVAAAIDSWSPTTITVPVPAFDLLGPAGFKDVSVRTPWGASATVAFELGELPRITSIAPPSQVPQGTVHIHGKAFGAARDRVEISGRFQEPFPMTVSSWSDTLVVAVVPTYATLRTTGDKQIVVTSRWGPSLPHEFVVSHRGAITAWTRLEVHARADDLEAGLAAGLRAEVYDALWLLGRQWQMREFAGEDAGSPVLARLTGETARLARWRAQGHAASVADVPPSVPLEALVEHEHVLPPRDGTTPFQDRRMAAESGLQWLRILARHLSRPTDIDTYRKRYVDWAGMALPTDQERDSLDVASLRFLEVVAGRVPDGARLYVELQQALPERGGRIPPKPPIAGNDRAGFLEAVAEWFAWWDDLFSQPTTGGQTWNSARMEYGFEASAETTDGEVVVSGPEYGGRRLDWYSLDLSGPGSLRADPAVASVPDPQALERVVVPVPVTFPGMAAPRFWQIEDAAVDFGRVASGPTDLIRLLFVEFAMVYGNDWFTFPVDSLPVGTLCRVASLTVTDTFGRQTDVGPLAESVGGFRMFDLGERTDLVFVADALPSAFESRPLEEVVLLRDELANLVWGVERVVTGPGGRPTNRVESWQERRRRATDAAPFDSEAGQPKLAYHLSTSVPDYWIPFVLDVRAGDDGSVSGRWLVRASLRAPETGTPILPEGELLGRRRPSLEVLDEVVARDGVRLRRHWQYGRAPDGSTHLWRTRRRDTGRGEGSSGLLFDLLERRL